MLKPFRDVVASGISDLHFPAGPCPVRFLCTFLMVFIGLAACAADNDEPKPTAPTPIAVRDVKRRSTVDFEGEVLPILKANCLACHNQTATKAELILETPQTI